MHLPYPQFNLLRDLGTSNIAFIRETLSNIASTQSAFGMTLTKPFLEDRSSDVSLHIQGYAPENKTIRSRLTDTLRNIVVIEKPTIATVETYPWPRDLKILLKGGIPPEGQNWLDHATQQSYKKLNPVTVVGLTLTILKRSHRRHFGQVEQRIPI